MTDFSSQEKVKKTLKEIREKVIAAAASGATEATLLNILTKVSTTQDLEVLLVKDTGAANIVVKEVKVLDQDTNVVTTTYEKADGTVHTAIGPLVYLDASTALALLLTELQAVNAKFGTLGQKASAGSAPMVLSTEQEVIINAIKTAVEGVVTVSLPTGTDTPAQSTDVAGVGSITAGKVKASLMNIGTTNATVLGSPLEPGISISFKAREGKTLGAISYISSATAILKIVTVS